METLHCLYFDDSAEQRERFGGWIEREWDWLDMGVPMKLQLAKSPEHAIQQLTQSTYQLFVADIIVGVKAGEPLGLKAIADAREDHPSLSILALSKGSFEERARTAGADGYISKSYMIERPELHILAEKILEVLRKHHHEPALSDPTVLDFDDDDLDLAVIMHSIGRKNVVNLSVRSLSKRCDRIVPQAIRPGLSGAIVLRVDCEIKVESGSPRDSRSLLLKASKSDELLRSELAKDISMFPDELFVRFLSREPVRSDQWYALASTFKVSSTSLDWMIKEPRTKLSVEQMVTALFIESGLSDVYRRGVFLKDVRPNVEIWRVLTPFRAARVLKNVESLDILAQKYMTDKRYESSYLRKFVRTGAVGRFDTNGIRKGVRKSWCHGDLHGRNVLITGNGPKLIDPANVDQFHCAMDLARFAVDLFVSGWDPGPMSHEWTLLNGWTDIVSRFVAGQEIVAESDENNNIANALNWLREHAWQICDLTAETEWQFWLAIGVEFLRASYRIEELPAPKRVLGLCAAYQALVAAESGIIAVGADL